MPMTALNIKVHTGRTITDVGVIDNNTSLRDRSQNKIIMGYVL
jgi:hypothetical protein